ncbi:MAG: [FeFe] hydrogenase H-cluster maturation GTPase HydF [Caldicoprobacterales bacterium]|nr:[FeFe] hydrogenase H-cluster maturation GTPase HydF [Bacillota bacterium]
MGLNNTPSGERIHIGFFGRRNSGKSSLVNAITGQDLALVSDIKGTTTDPVYKAMELAPLGPVMIIDTPGIDDKGELGDLRVKKTYQVLNKTDLAILVIDAVYGKAKEEKEIEALFKEKKINYLIVYNKIDLVAQNAVKEDNVIYVSAKTGYRIRELKEKIAGLAISEKPKQRLVADLIKPSDFVVLVTPIDQAAPKGRLILPQQQTIRDILDADATAIVVKDTDLSDTLDGLGKKPRMVITDSQAFERVAAVTPEDIYLTSFSILFARYKGILDHAVKGARALDKLEDGDTILISEGCTHHRQCEDIGTVKIPAWIRDYTKKDFNFKFSSGGQYPTDLAEFKLIIHCGGCMLNEKEMRYRLNSAVDQGVPITNYGILISYMQGILDRSIAVFPNLLEQIEG